MFLSLQYGGIYSTPPVLKAEINSYEYTLSLPASVKKNKSQKIQL